MSIQFSQAKLKAEERKAILQAIESQMQQVIIEGVMSMVGDGIAPATANPEPCVIVSDHTAPQCTVT